MEWNNSNNNTANKIHIDATVKIGNYDMRFKATGYRTPQNSLFSVILYDKLYELQGSRQQEEGYCWHFINDNMLPEDLATIIGREIEKVPAEA
ncbi:hypothetical protein [Taibaiella koreensis]|uniref:hypothetical protein n=1 Tax=Taibaiella koreensis TaxID=1268548 RepID=UPI000E59B446|nr:hypothetical protein [Taibaiella koreensis]